ncbi:MAG: nitroreductase family protein [Turicibacter sp.]|nr:nitroreductase family protein [Turicibacter sp.]
MSIIDQRQSVRKFNGTPVEAKKVERLIKAGMAAPSSKNKQPFAFIAIDEEGLIAEFSKAHPNWAGLSTANKLIVACGDKSKDGRDAQMLMAVAAAIQNILLRAVEEGLGAVWVGMYPDGVRMGYASEKLGLPGHIVPVAIIAVGYNENTRPKIREFDPTSIRYNGWGQ